MAGKIPTVAVGGVDPDLPHVDVLANDNHLGGTLAVRHLLEFGHRRIAHLSGLPSAAGRLRLRAYQDTMRAAGLGEQVLIETGDMTEEGGYRAAVRLLSGPGGRPPSSRRMTCPASAPCPRPRRWAFRSPASCRWSVSATPAWPACGRCG